MISSEPQLFFWKHHDPNHEDDDSTRLSFAIKIPQFWPTFYQSIPGSLQFKQRSVPDLKIVVFCGASLGVDFFTKKRWNQDLLGDTKTKDILMDLVERYFQSEVFSQHNAKCNTSLLIAKIEKIHAPNKIQKSSSYWHLFLYAWKKQTHAWFQKK